MNTVNSTTVYGDHPDPRRARVLYALHPISGRWWRKSIEARNYGWRGDLPTEEAWQQSEPSVPQLHSLVRMHRLDKPRHARKAILPTHDPRRPTGYKDLPWTFAGSVLATDLRDHDRSSTRNRQLEAYALGYHSHPNCRCAVDLVGPAVYDPRNQKEDTTMTTPNAQRAQEQAATARIPADARRIQVQFPGNSTRYTYLTQDQSIVQGDLVLVNSPQNGIVTVRVVGVDPTVDGVKHAFEWIVDRVDPAKVQAYQDRKDRESSLKALDAQIARQRKIALDRLNERTLAQADPDLAALLAQRDELEGVKRETTEETFRRMMFGR